MSDYYSVPMDALQGQKRDKAIVVPRQIAMFLMREETDVSLLRIGAELGGRDHSTVLHACDKITREVGRQRRAAPRDRRRPRADLRRLSRARRDRDGRRRPAWHPISAVAVDNRANRWKTMRATVDIRAPADQTVTGSVDDPAGFGSDRRAASDPSTVRPRRSPDRRPPVHRSDRTVHRRVERRASTTVHRVHTMMTVMTE